MSYFKSLRSEFNGRIRARNGLNSDSLTHPLIASPGSSSVTNRSELTENAPRTQTDEIVLDLQNSKQDNAYFRKLQRTGVDPLTKWIKYGRPPIKLGIHLVLVILTTLQVVNYSDTTITYLRASYGTWNHIIVGQPDVSAGSSMYLYEVDETLNHINQTVDQFYNLVSTSVGRYFWVKDSDGMIVQPQLEVWAFDVDEKDCPFSGKAEITNCKIHSTTSVCTLEDPLGGIPENDTRQFFDQLVRMKLTFRVKNTAILQDRSLCYIWNIVSTYDFTSRGGRIYLSWTASRRVCSDAQTYWYMSPMESLVLLAGAILLFSFMSLILTFKAISRSVSLYLGTKKRLYFRDSSESYWDSLSFKDKLIVLRKFFDVWHVIVTFGNACNVMSSIAGIMIDLGSLPDSSFYRFMTGMGCMFAWINMIRYLEYNEKSYALILTLKNGTPGVLRFAVGAAPVFVGYALFGVVYFGADTELFDTVDNACATLFALLNGDSVLQIFTTLYHTSPFVSRFYLYTFVGLFIFAVFNIFVAIIEEAFRNSKSEEQDAETPPLEPHIEAAIRTIVAQSHEDLLAAIQAMKSPTSPATVPAATTDANNNVSNSGGGENSTPTSPQTSAVSGDASSNVRENPAGVTRRFSARFRSRSPGPKSPIRRATIAEAQQNSDNSDDDDEDEQVTPARSLSSRRGSPRPMSQTIPELSSSLSVGNPLNFLPMPRRGGEE
eukprot:c10021_g1_i1.p1 GENE.c10021_g1_i1~~c10021_g1_i1.p1  ORF type:complete len:716 (+),score=156.34 c10021_g1_i1:24-2171(+)